MIIDAAIFDLDGVLVSSIPLHFEAFRRTFADAGKEFTMDDYVRLGAGAPRDVLIRRVLGELPECQFSKLMAAKERHMAECIGETGIEPIPGACEFVDAVRQRGLKTAVATASRTPDLLLGAAGLGHLFDTVVDRHDVERPKPHPEIFLRAAQILDVEPARALVLEDSPAGIEAGVAAGMRVLALSTTRPASELTRADAVFAGFDDIPLDDWL